MNSKAIEIGIERSWWLSALNQKVLWRITLHWVNYKKLINSVWIESMDLSLLEFMMWLVIKLIG